MLTAFHFNCLLVYLANLVLSIQNIILLFWPLMKHLNPFSTTHTHTHTLAYIYIYDKFVIIPFSSYIILSVYINISPTYMQFSYSPVTLCFLPSPHDNFLLFVIYFLFDGSYCCMSHFFIVQLLMNFFVFLSHYFNFFPATQNILSIKPNLTFKIWFLSSLLIRFFFSRFAICCFFFYCLPVYTFFLQVLKPRSFVFWVFFFFFTGLFFLIIFANFPHLTVIFFLFLALYFINLTTFLSFVFRLILFLFLLFLLIYFSLYFFPFFFLLFIFLSFFDISFFFSFCLYL